MNCGEVWHRSMLPTQPNRPSHYSANQAQAQLLLLQLLLPAWNQKGHRLQSLFNIFFAIYMAFLCHLHFKLVNVFLYYWWTAWMQTWFSNEFCHTNYSLKMSTVPFNPWSSQALKKSKLNIILLFLHHSCHIINPKICSQLNVHRQITYRNQVISTAEPQSLPEQNAKLFSSSCPSCAALWDTNTVTGNGKLQRKKSANTQQSYLQSLHPHLNGVYGHALYI